MADSEQRRQTHAQFIEKNRAYINYMLAENKRRSLEMHQLGKHICDSFIVAPKKKIIATPPAANDDENYDITKNNYNSSYTSSNQHITRSTKGSTQFKVTYLLLSTLLSFHPCASR